MLIGTHRIERVGRNMRVFNVLAISFATLAMITFIAGSWTWFCYDVVWSTFFAIMGRDF